MNLTGYEIGVGNRADLALFDAPSWYGALNFDAPVVDSCRGGRLTGYTKCGRERGR